MYRARSGLDVARLDKRFRDQGHRDQRVVFLIKEGFWRPMLGGILLNGGEHLAGERSERKLLASS